MNGMDLSVSIHIKDEFGPNQPIDFWYSLLTKIPLFIGLSPVTPPLIYKFPTTEYPHELGISGLILIVQSHISFHWWPATNFLHLTISSCKIFDEEELMDTLQLFFPTQSMGATVSRWESESDNEGEK